MSVLRCSTFMSLQNTRARKAKATIALRLRVRTVFNTWLNSQPAMTMTASQARMVSGMNSALRQSSPGPLYDFYVAVHPSMRRQGLGRALSEPALSARARLRARVRDDAFAGRAFATALGFVETGAQLSLQWGGGKVEVPPMPALRIRTATRRDEQALRKLSSDAWVESAETNFSRADEIAQLFAEEGRLVLLAESEGKPMGYLSAVQLGRTLGIEEVAVLPQFRRMGVGRGLLGHVMVKSQGAVLSVSEANKPARALYRSLGFRQTARRLVLERR